MLYESIRSGTRRGAALTSMACGLLLAHGSSALAYEAGNVSNGGTIEGQVRYPGSVPTKRIIPSNPDTCGDPRDIALIETNADGMVTDAVVYLEDVDSGKPWPDQAEPPTLDNVGCRFRPQLVAMPPGPIAILNSDGVLHNTHAFYGRRTAFNIALPNQGQRIEKELRRPGILRVECDEHGHMSARVFVAANPYYATTYEDGRFTITDVPAGTYTLIAYQEETGPVETEITIDAGETIALDVNLEAQSIQQR